LVCEDIFKEDVFQFDEFENRKFVWSVFEAGELYQMKYSPVSNSRWLVDFTKIFSQKMVEFCIDLSPPRKKSKVNHRE